MSGSGRPGFVRLEGGRRFAYDDVGDPAGTAVMAFHGTPGSRVQLAPGHQLALRLGVRSIVPDRPGYGASSWNPRHSLTAWPDDVAALADHLGLERFAVVGLSGGGPHALAVAWAMPDRVRSVATVGGVAPLEPRDPTLPPDRMVTRVARRSEVGARVIFEALIRFGRRNPERALDRFAAALADCDRESLTAPTPIRDAFLADLASPAPTAARAAARDFWLFARPWGFRLDDIAVPVQVWHGSHDRNVPVEHGRVIASSCSQATLHEVEEGGHLLLASYPDEVFASMNL